MSVNFFLLFLTGLTTGGLSCLAMQGGLLASVIANQKNQEGTQVEKTITPKKLFSLSTFSQPDWLPIIMFLAAKLIAHGILGFLLGWLGSTMSLSLEVRLLFQGLTALFMLATALNLLHVHPVFRYVVFQPPKFIQRLVRNSSKSRTLFAPAVLGALTVFIPCGVTQAVEVQAITSGSPILGAAIMLVFVLGTLPLFALLGAATTQLSQGWHHRFSRVAAVALIAMAILSINGVLVVLGSPVTLGKIVSPIRYFFSEERFEDISAQSSVSGVQSVTINVLNTGYQPNRIRVKRGQSVQLTLQSHDTYSCALSFIFKEFGIQTFLEATDTQTFVFTPTKAGTYQFTCSMGMYTGVMEVL